MTMPPKHSILYRQLWIGVICMVLLGGFVAVQYYVQSKVTLPYSLHDEPASNLGATVCDYYKSLQNGEWAHVCSPQHWVMNIGFMAYGVLLMLAAAFAVRGMWPAGRLRSLGIMLLFLGGIELVIVGASPVNLTVILHNVAGFLALVALNTGLLVLGIAAFRTERMLAWFTLCCGLAGLTGFVMTFMPVPVYPWLGYGGWQRVALNACVAWAVLTGLFWAGKLLFTKPAQR